MLITAFISARHLSLFWSTSIQSMSPSHFLKIHLNIIFSSTPESSSGLFPLGFPIKIMYTSLLSPVHAKFPAHLIIDLLTRILFGEDYRKLISSLCSFLHCSVTAFLFDSNIRCKSKVNYFNIQFSPSSSPLSCEDQLMSCREIMRTKYVICWRKVEFVTLNMAIRKEASMI